jgi:UDP-glucose 4-epimerase
MKERLAVIGGNGFIGRHLVQGLSGGYDVRVFDRPGSQSAGDATFFPGDLSGGPQELLPCLGECSTMVYLVHLAGSSPHRDPDMLALVKNLELFLNALEAASLARIQKVVFFSSGGSVYGIPHETPISEDHPLNPISAYGICKLTMEKYLALFCGQRGMDHVIVRPSNPFGPGQDFQRLQGAIAVFMHRILSGQPVEIWGDGKGKKDYFAVQDLASALVALLGNSKACGAYNVGCGTGTSLLEIVSAIEKATGKTATVIFKERKENDVPEFVLNCSRIRDLTGWEPTITFQEGVERIAAWMLKQGKY